MDSHELIDYPKSRVATFDVGRISRDKHEIIGLLEVNILHAKDKIKSQIKNGKEISLYSWILKTIAHTIAEHRTVQALNYKRNKQVVFDDVDISLPLEKTVKGKKVPLALLIRKVDKKSIAEIKREIDAAVNKDIDSEKDYVLSQNKTNRLNNLFFSSPQWLRMCIWKLLLSNPFSIKKNIGTAIVTNIGITSAATGWIIPKSLHNLCFGIGSISKKPVVKNNSVEIGLVMHLTVKFNHDVVDGAPAAKFVAKLVKNLEDAAVL